MVRSRRPEVALTLILLAGTAQCGSSTDAPGGQALLYIDTDAPSISLAREQEHAFLTEAAVDLLRIDILDPDNRVVSSTDVAAPDEMNWPVSFGIKGLEGAVVSRVRLRAFRSQRAAVTTDPNTNTKVFEPIAGYVIDRVVEVPVPYEKGVFAFRVVLRSACRGYRPDFTRHATCVAEDRKEAGFRDDIESVAADTRPAREALWWPGDLQRTDSSQSQDCANAKDHCPPHSVCIPGGFFMLGNPRVVGFGPNTDAVPPHPVVMKPFCIDATEYTVERYKGSEMPINTMGRSETDPYGNELCTWVPDNSDVNLPMNCVTHEEAAALCEQSGGRLPTEAEWEYVATNLGRGSLFPWGDAPPTCNSAVLEQQETDFLFAPECGFDGLLPVAKGENGKQDIVKVWQDPTDNGGSDQGVWHMAGSLSEWTLDSYTSYGNVEPTTNCWQRQGLFVHPCCGIRGLTKTIRGGSFAEPLEYAYAPLRRGDQKTTSSALVGFRCVYSVQGEEEDPVQYIEPNPEQPFDPSYDAGPIGDEEPPGGIQ
ncbi:MAG TPA: SUMF1/EgtB/PvdO family nonheme iron enzyme [Polyangiaceae bacterium]|nr:SUMF1/EgtB/PvdO family nonheme iron enzyme [Polyangiaceae bacterium]HNZ21414.1 SUMF1/EgtB/PvdO family nonheme iron enzyme [Polyangiaceae bacterium]HOD23266.1 SUMF1/EgtB/PvdO family nonheme iron enzyme [Polyangiaceae bacterium]HOE47410.1 SUMF1/EgtB/PvdO family nonheme iron enzyme [Polyangiaceae bacterium]HOH02753.1 SUMF1/EgtB/PvdO family nonheme iron enzyme [Polyangiaceae bacterium]